MTEPSPPQEAVVTWNIETNSADGTVDFVFDVTPPVDALIDVQRFVPVSAREAARRRGVSEEELEGPVTVAENIPVKRGRGSWRDFFPETGVTYQYRIRAHHLAGLPDREEQVAAKV